MHARFLLGVPLLLALACGGGDDDAPAKDAGLGFADASFLPDASLAPDDDGGEMAADGGGEPTGCPAGEAILDPLPAGVAFGVISSDFSSTSVSFLSASGEVLAEGWIDSGTTAPVLSATLGGDVGLATGVPEGTVMLIDRFGADVVTRLCADGSLLGQGRLTPESVSLNVQDAVILEGGRGFASRFEQNPAGDAADADRGTDLIGFDAETVALSGERVDLAQFNDMVDGLDPESGDPVSDVTVFARPGAIVRRGATLVVGLARLPGGFEGPRAHGEGSVALVDAESLAVSGFTLPGSLANCDQVTPVAGSESDVIVSCKGYSNVSFSDTLGVRETAGIVRLSIEDGTASVVSSWEAASDADGPLAGWNTVSLGGDVVVSVAFGDFAAETGDRLLRIDLGSGTVTEVATTTGAFQLGGGSYRAGGPLLVPDAEAGAIRRFRVEGATLTEEESVSIGPATLPPRSVRAL